jgi:hypothetical protein
MKVVHSDELWELSVDGQILHIFADVESAEKWAGHPDIQEAFKLLRPGARITINPIAVMKVVEDDSLD